MRVVERVNRTFLEEDNISEVTPRTRCWRLKDGKMDAGPGGSDGCHKKIHIRGSKNNANRR